MSLPFERAAVAPDVDVVFLHRDDEHRAGDGAAERRGVEVGHAGGGDVEGAALQRRDPFGDHLRAAVDEARLLGAVLQRLARDLVVVGFVGLAQVGGVGVGDRALRPHPVERRAGVETAGKRDADLLAGGKTLKNVDIGWGGRADRPYLTSTSSSASRLGPSIMTARVSPSCVGSARGIFTFSARSFATQASRSATLRPT